MIVGVQDQWASPEDNQRAHEEMGSSVVFYQEIWGFDHHTVCNGNNATAYDIMFQSVRTLLDHYSV